LGFPKDKCAKILVEESKRFLEYNDDNNNMFNNRYHMMCISSGKERTADEYSTLLERAGWKYVQTLHPHQQTIIIRIRLNAE
jgi:hypothetical protein